MKEREFFLGYTKSPKEGENLKSDLTLMEESISQDPNMISKGGYGDVYVSDLINNDSDSIGKIETYAKKNYRSGIDHEKILWMFDIRNKLEALGLPVIDLYTDGGDNIFTPYLNNENTIALSANNNVDSSYENNDGEMIRFNNLEIKISNLNNLIDKIIMAAYKSGKAGIELSYDSLFFLVDIKTDESEIDFIIADFDLIKTGEEKCIEQSLKGLRHGLEFFIRKYSEKKYVSNYLEQISKKLDLSSEEVLTQRGVIPIKDFNFDQDIILDYDLPINNSLSQDIYAKFINKIQNTEYLDWEIAKNQSEVTENTKYCRGVLEIIPGFDYSDLYLDGDLYIKHIYDNLILPKEISGKIYVMKTESYDNLKFLANKYPKYRQKIFNNNVEVDEEKKLPEVW